MSNTARIMIVSTAFACIPSGVFAGDCGDVYAKASNYRNGTIFYNSDQGFVVASSSKPIKGIVDNTVYLLRKNIDRFSAGGVLVVKTAVPKKESNESQVTLKTRFTEKQITKCRQNADLRRRLGEFFGKTVTYEQFQDYIRNPRAAAILPSDVKRRLDKIHFAYRGATDICTQA